jgi:hypothetical protein
MKRKLVVWIASAAALAFVALLYVGSHSGYDSRAHVATAIEEAQPLKARVEQFHAKQKALPQGDDVRAARAALSLKRARQVDWDAANGSVVITMDGEPYPGKRFAYVAQIKDDRLEWACRPLDMAPKYLPANCRGL